MTARLGLIGMVVSCLLFQACVVDPGGLIRAAARNAREAAIVGKPRRAQLDLLDILRDDQQLSADEWLEDERFRRVEIYLQGALDDLVREANSTPAILLDNTPARTTIPKVPVRLVPDLEPCVLADNNEDAPEVEVCLGYMFNLALATNAFDETVYLADDHQVGDLADDSGPLVGGLAKLMEGQMNRMMLELQGNLAAIEFQEAVLFSLAHEVSHIWMDSTGNKEGKESRADAYGMLLTFAVSPAVERQAQLQAEFSRTLSISVSDPVDIVLMSAEFGPTTVFKVYKDYCFEETCYAQGDNTHLPPEVRLKASVARGNDLVDRFVSEMTNSDVTRSIVFRNLKDALLGYETDGV